MTEATYRLNVFSRDQSPRRNDEMPAIGAVFRTQLDEIERVGRHGGDTKKKMTDLIKTELVQYVRVSRTSLTLNTYYPPLNQYNLLTNAAIGWLTIAVQKPSSFK